MRRWGSKKNQDRTIFADGDAYYWESKKENQVNAEVGRNAFEFLKGSKSSKINSVWEFDKWLSSVPSKCHHLQAGGQLLVNHKHITGEPVQDPEDNDVLCLDI